jgi:hypothetical protein
MRKIVVMSVVLAGAGAAWAGGGRMSLQESAQYAFKAARAGREARAASSQTTFTDIAVTNAAGNVIIAGTPDPVGDALVGWGNAAGTPKGLLLVSDQNAGQVAVFNTAGNPHFILDGNSGLLSLPGDVAERFPAAAALQPGSVVAIDAASKGALVAADRPYDRRVAGVVSGANDYRPGITLRVDPALKNAVPVTLTGTVYCLASDVNGAIHAGDLLTTSSIPGHAMRVSDAAAAHGAIVGKALEDLKGDRGLVMILASLQ